jgi:hypothetical protein
MNHKEIERAICSASDGELLELADVARRFSPSLFHGQFATIIRTRLHAIGAASAASEWDAHTERAPALPEVPVLPDTTLFHHLFAIIADPATSRAKLDQFATVQGVAEAARAEAIAELEKLAAARAEHQFALNSASDQQARDLAAKRAEVDADLAKRTREVARRENAAAATAAALQQREEKLRADTTAVEQLRADLQRRMAALKAAAA